MIDMAANKSAIVQKIIDAKAYKLYLENEIKGGMLIAYDEKLMTKHIIPFLHKLYEPYEAIHRRFLKKGKKSPKSPTKELSHMKQLVIECAKDMILFIINDVCKGFWQSGKIHALSGSCLSIAIKLICAFDFGNHRTLLADISTSCDSTICPKKLLVAMEKDILERTDYQGCHSIIGINKTYNARFKELTRVNSQRSPKSPTKSPTTSPSKRKTSRNKSKSPTKSPSKRKTSRNKSKSPRSGSAANP